MVFTLSERGKAMLVRINGRRAPLLAQWMHTNEILALARAGVAVTAVDPATVVQLILVQAQHEHALGLGSYQERFVKLVKSARKVAAGRSVRDLAEFEGCCGAARACRRSSLTLSLPCSPFKRGPCQVLRHTKQECERG